MKKEKETFPQIASATADLRQYKEREEKLFLV
jgi:hypothetical protein